VLRFDYSSEGLIARGGEPLRGFAIAGEDRQFVSGDAKIVDDTVVVSSPAVPEPVSVRYGWANNPNCNLYNQVGLPASPFRTDDWPAPAPVTGRVTLDGKALAGATVTFEPHDGRPAQGLTDEQGRFELRLRSEVPGVDPGQYTVTVEHVPRAAVHDATRPAIPAKYSSKSELSFEVQPGPNVIEFDLVGPEK
jgi:hypothetical protein